VLAMMSAQPAQSHPDNRVVESFQGGGHGGQGEFFCSAWLAGGEEGGEESRNLEVDALGRKRPSVG
jgi:hypothetical protein